MSNSWWYDEGCPCSACGKLDAEEQYCMGVYAGKYCDDCFKERYRVDAQFDPADAGESMEEV